MKATQQAGKVFVDVTELFQNPVRTGIQRVVRELLREWPDFGLPLHPVRFESGLGLLGIPTGAVALLTEDNPEIRQMSYDELRLRLQQFACEQLDESDLASNIVLIPEIFFDEARCRFYEDRLRTTPGSVAMLFYDFLPYLRSELFQLTNLLPLMHYARLARMAPYAAFISDETRQNYASRVKHSRVETPTDINQIGPVLPLGSDGLAIEKQYWSPDRHLFASIGSIDGRKNQHLIVNAFVRLWESGCETPLVLIGRAFDNVSLSWIRAAHSYPYFKWMDSATDEEVATVLRKARGTIYASEAEGFGLPPVESLAAGIPVIASAKIPSLSMLSPFGQIRLTEITPETIANAVLAMGPDLAAEGLWEEAASLQLDTWRNFADKAAGWCDHVSGVATLHQPSLSRESFRI